jgi:Dihaem cytochrome c
MKRIQSAMLSVCILALSGTAAAADDRFAKDAPNSLNGFLVVTDARYLKECGACHIAYSPGLLPARSWRFVLGNLDKHFGESLKLSPDASSAILQYLTENAMETSPYAGSKTLLEKLSDGTTPHRIMLIPFVAYRHAVVREAIAKNGKVQVKRLANCSDCHTKAAAGSFALAEMFIPGLTPGTR